MQKALGTQVMGFFIFWNGRIFTQKVNPGTKKA
jgi:hypothetical protein